MTKGRTARRALAVLALLLLVSFSSAVRVHTAFADPNFDSVHVEGMLKSDPALLYYFTERVLAADGGIPEDFRADTRVQHPGPTDIPAEFTVGQEFLIAWAYRSFGGELPLHVFCVRLMAVIASCAALGVFLLTHALTGRFHWALLATALFALSPANYRTIGFILVREDLSLPLFALHLGLLAVAARRGRPGLFLLAGLAVGAALATWHAMGFFVAVELACLFAWFLRTGCSPFELHGSWAVLLGPVIVGALVPALRSQAFLTSLPMQLALALVAAQWVRARAVEPSRARVLGGAVLAWSACAGIDYVWHLGSPAGYSHVWDVLAAKLAHAGVFPADPNEISFDARLLWQGPFDTLNLRWALGEHAWLLVLGLPAVFVALRGWWRGDDAGTALLGAGASVSLFLAWLFARMIVLTGILLPAVAAVACARHAGKRWALPAFCVALVLQGLSFLDFASDHLNRWYLPPGRQTEIAELVEWVRKNVPTEEPIAADFMNSAALLAHAGNPIVLQPKYETDRSRRRAEVFLTTFFHASPAELRRLVRERFRCRYLLIDTYTLWTLSRATAGVAAGQHEPTPGTAAAVFLSRDEDVLRSLDGFDLIYRSPVSNCRPSGAPYDFFRLYRID